MKFKKGDTVKVIGVSRGIRVSSATARKWTPVDIGVVVKVSDDRQLRYDVLFPDGKKQSVPQKDLKKA